MLTDMFNINTSSRHKEYSKFSSSWVTVHADYVTTVSWMFTAALDQRFQASLNRSGSWQSREQSSTTSNCRS